MKTTLKTKILFAAILFRVCTVNATDLIVQENGPSGTYASINSAVTAANDGDRIVINNRLGGLPWLEDVTITKELMLMSAAADSFFLVQGNYTISTNAAGKKISIIGMKNILGDIKASSSAISGSRTNINIFGCWLTKGIISFSSSNYNVMASGNYIENGYISISFGKITGNFINGSIYIYNDGDNTSDTIFVVGNKVTEDFDCIYWSNSSQNMYIANNYITKNIHTSDDYSAIKIASIKSNSNNNILNNTLTISGNTYSSNYGYRDSYGIYVVSLGAGSTMNIENNFIVAGNTYTVGIDLNSPTTVNCSYNYIDNGCGTKTNAVNNGTNVTNLDLSLSNGQPVGGGVNGADPNPIYNDLDKTRGDAGAYGGSLALNNFFSSYYSGYDFNKNRIYFMQAPRTVIKGNNLTINADSYDR